MLSSLSLLSKTLLSKRLATPASYLLFPSAKFRGFSQSSNRSFSTLNDNNDYPVSKYHKRHSTPFIAHVFKSIEVSDKIFHISPIVLALAFPTAFLVPASYSSIILASNYILSVLIPLHAQFGCNAIISEYVPRGRYETTARYFTTLLSLGTMSGFIYYTYKHDGVSGLIRDIWTPYNTDKVISKK